MADYKDPDAFYDNRFRAILAGINENAGETRRQAAVILGAQAPGGAEQSIGEQVLRTKVDDTNAVRQVLLDMGSRVAHIEAVVSRIAAKLGAE